MMVRFKWHVENISLYQKPKSPLCSHPSRLARGAFRPIVTRRGARDAMDANARNGEARNADGEIVWSRFPDAGINPRDGDVGLAADTPKARGDGGQRARRTEEITYKP
jgi:hypothetical protein